MQGRGLGKSLVICSSALSSQEAEEKKKQQNKTICNYMLGKLNSRKQTVNITAQDKEEMDRNTDPIFRGHSERF